MINLFGTAGSFQGLYGASKGYSNTSFGTIQKEQKQRFKEEQYNDIYEHEKAHKDAAGELGGPIVIENNAQGIPVQGHVDIKMPVLDKTNPDKTIKHADTVIKSAMAPDNPSVQDYKVANEAKSIKSQAESEKHKNGSDNKNNSALQTGKNLNLFA